MTNLIDRMLEPSFYPHPVTTVRLVQTHISYVFLTGTRAYKVKKPVNFGFLDFSTLAKRQFFCAEELRLNQRLAPDLYEMVLPITETDGAYQLDGTGTVVEYALRMREFSQDCLFSNLFVRGEVTLAHMEQLGQQMARFYREAAVNDHIRSFGDPAVARQPIDDNYQQTERYIGVAQTREQFTQTKAFTDQIFQEQADLLQARVAGDRFRECHGDLHLGNICLLDQPVVFDCIEFNEPFRFIDVLSDIGFLVMDLVARERPDLANRFLNTCLEWTGDWAGLPLLPLYLSYRAYVRAKVTSFLLDDPGIGAEQKAQAQTQAANYYRLAWQFTQPQTPKLYVMQGLSGSGKSTVARELALRTQAIHLRSDAVRKHLAGHPLTEKLSTEFYTAEFSQKTYQQMADLAERLLKNGFSVILDAKYDRQVQRGPILALAEELGVTVRILACRCREEVLRTRLEARTGDIADADASLIAAQQQAQEDFSEAEADRVLFLNTQAPIVWDLLP
ncbi:bifunctional aminoglycoside phosphotransferase/ATP-binding protein [Candidatus Cyanaurora vandensis]|uniref:bifunctional aminoglycoside phosphotransferase/ATP-binding protein n=1 Tax=Candidatus Cyanaurora vandensis TaxID=2714958 RepID=UPI00257D7F1B|nr:bifunctional aminoglycoside phosphotransferase/ATP-binding protein [Candidatus Cyanaurora vandensis]